MENMMATAITMDRTVIMMGITTRVIAKKSGPSIEGLDLTPGKK
jgi:hypothetical protein